MTMETDWIKVDQDQLDRPMRVNVRGAQIIVHLSPYDVPEAIRGIWIAPNQVFAIQLRYFIEDEATIKLKSVGGVTPHVGKNSGRLQQLDIDLRQLKFRVSGENTSIQTAVRGAIGSLNGLVPSPRTENYRVAQEAIDGNPQLIPA